jgi:hypothetical protein
VGGMLSLLKDKVWNQHHVCFLLVDCIGRHSDMNTRIFCWSSNISEKLFELKNSCSCITFPSMLLNRIQCETDTPIVRGSRAVKIWHALGQMLRIKRDSAALQA